MTTLKESLLLAKFLQLYKQLPRQIKTLFLRAIIVGLAIFLLEISFIKILSLLFYKVGILKLDNPYGFFDHLHIGIVLLSVLTVSFIRQGLSALKFYLAGSAESEYIKYIRLHIVDKLSKSPTLNESDTFTAFTNHAENAGRTLSFFSNIFVLLMSSLLYMLYSLYLSWSMTILGGVVAFIIFFPLKLLEKNIYGIYSDIVQNKNFLNQKFSSFLYHSKYFRLFNTTKLLDSLDNEISNFSRKNIILSFINGIKKSYSPFGGVIIIIVLIGIFKNSSVNNGELITIFYLFLKMGESLGNVHFQSSLASLNLESFQKVREQIEGFSRLSKAKETMTFESLKIEKVFVPGKLISPVSLELKRGDVVRIEGPSGVGKTSLVDVLTGNNREFEGQLLINQQNASFDSVKNVMVIDSSPFLYPGTLRDNLTIFCSEKDNDLQTIEALKKVGLEMYTSFLNENIIDFSSGEKQKICMARCFLGSLDVLILDEAMSNLPLKDQRIILSNLLKSSHLQLLIYIGHLEGLDEFFNQKIYIS